MLFCTTEELSYDIAYRAYVGSSFHPHERAKQDQKEFSDHLNAVYAEMEALSIEPQQKEVFQSEMARYKNGFKERYIKKLNAKSRTLNWAVTGRGNFPVRRNQKRLDIEHKRLEELLEYDKKAQAAIKKAILNARSPEVKHSAEFEALKKDILGSMATAKRIDEENYPFNRSAFVNSAVGMIQRRADNGQIDLAKQLLNFIDEAQKDWKKPFITKRHKVWKILDIVPAELPELPQGETEIANGEGFRIVKNFDLDRVQMFFDAIPSATIRSSLKSSGWNWSRSNGAWQRKITENAVYSAKQIVNSIEKVG